MKSINAQARSDRMPTLEEMERAWHNNHRFIVVCAKSIRSKLRVIGHDRSYEDANRIAEALQIRFYARHPGHSSWTSRHYWSQLYTSAKHAKKI